MQSYFCSDVTNDYQQVSTSVLDRVQPVVYSSLTEASVAKHYSFFIASGNVCLMPEFTARINNLSCTVKRAERIAAYLCNSALNYTSTKSQKLKRGGKSNTLFDRNSCESMDYLNIGLGESFD